MHTHTGLHDFEPFDANDRDRARAGSVDGGQSRYVMLVKVDNKSAPAVVQALIKQVRRLPKELKKSLTWDRGLEMAHHKNFSIAMQMDVYFCDPRSPWQRGTNENTNRLTRQYLPKRSDLSEHSQAELNKVALQLNPRPRETLGFRCPADKFGECVALTAWADNSSDN
jgi:IS30 family transposase